MQFSSCLLAGNTFIHVNTRVDLFLYFQVKSFSFFVEILCFGFCLVSSDCDAYLAVDHSLVYSYAKMFLLFFSLIWILIPGLKPLFSITFRFRFRLVFCS